MVHCVDVAIRRRIDVEVRRRDLDGDVYMTTYNNIAFDVALRRLLDVFGSRHSISPILIPMESSYAMSC